MPAGEWPHIFSAITAFGLEFSQRECSPFSQKKHLPQEIGNGTTTRWPAFRFFTPGPVSITSPINSWPIMSPFPLGGRKGYLRGRLDRKMAGGGFLPWGRA